MGKNDVRLIGSRVRAERLRRGITQTQLAESISNEWIRRYPSHKPITQKWISALENSTMQLTNLERVVLIAKVFDIPVSELLADEETPRTEDHALRLVLRMHGIPSSVSEDVVREFRLIEEQTRQKQAMDAIAPPPSPEDSPRAAKATPDPADDRPPPTP